MILHSPEVTETNTKQLSSTHVEIFSCFMQVDAPNSAQVQPYENPSLRVCRPLRLKVAVAEWKRVNNVNYLLMHL